MAKNQKGIQSIEVGFSIIDVLLKSSSPLPLKEISIRSGLTPSKIHSYLVSFSNLGLVEQDLNTNHYNLGPFALQLGLGYLEQVNLFSITKPIMEDMALKLNQTIFLGVWGNRGPTIIYRVDGVNSQAIFDLRIGSVLPILKSALGLNFAAHLSESVSKNFIDLEFSTTDLYSTRAELNNALKTIRDNGVSKSNGKLLSDYTAISAPIFDFSGTMIAGLTVMGPVNKLNDTLTGNAVKILKEGALEISMSRGYKK